MSFQSQEYIVEYGVIGFGYKEVNQPLELTLKGRNNLHFFQGDMMAENTIQALEGIAVMIVLVRVAET